MTHMSPWFRPKTLFAAGLALLGLTGAAATLRGAISPPPGPEAEIQHIEQIAFDGAVISVVYGVNTSCSDPADNLTVAKLVALEDEPGWRVALVNQSRRYCGGSAQWVRLADRVDISAQVESLRGSSNASYQLVLPTVTLGRGKPTPWGGLMQDPGGVPQGGQAPVGKQDTIAGAAPGGTQWECVLFKRDGAKRDGFTGVNKDQRQARAEASQGCKRTNNPRCDEWSLDPDHTTCRLVQYRCVLWKNDGAKRDGFEGTGETEEAARQQSAYGCQRTNNPKCDEWSKDNSHTKCERVYVEK